MVLETVTLNQSTYKNGLIPEENEDVSGFYSTRGFEYNLVGNRHVRFIFINKFNGKIIGGLNNAFVNIKDIDSTIICRISSNGTASSHIYTQIDYMTHANNIVINKTIDDAKNVTISVTDFTKELINAGQPLPNEIINFIMGTNQKELFETLFK